MVDNKLNLKTYVEDLSSKVKLKTNALVRMLIHNTLCLGTDTKDHRHQV